MNIQGDTVSPPQAERPASQVPARLTTAKARCMSSNSGNYLVKGLPKCFMPERVKADAKVQRRPMSTFKGSVDNAPDDMEAPVKFRRPITSKHGVFQPGHKKNSSPMLDPVKMSELTIHQARATSAAPDQRNSLN